MSKYVNFNGELIVEDRALFGAENRAFRYGDALFETIRIAGGRVLFFDVHWKRLTASMDVLGYDISSIPGKSEMLNELDRLIQRCRIAKGGVARLSVYRENGGLYTPTTKKCSFLIEIRDAEPSFSLDQVGINLGIFNDHLKSKDKLSTLKSANSLLYTLAGQFAAQSEYDDVLLLNTEHLIAEALSSNVFVLVKDQLVTPGLSQGCIPGVMRAVVMEIARRLQVDVIQAPVSVDTLQRADEIWLTNAVQGIRWVMSFNRKRYYHKEAVRFQKALIQLTTGEEVAE